MNPTKSIAQKSLLIAIALILSWMESQIPPFFSVPGIKLGLTNIVVLYALYSLSNMDAFIINGIRILIVGMTFGSPYSMIYALSGAIVSYITMILMKKYTNLSITIVSITGAILHNVGQILVAMVLFSTSSILLYLPVLWVSGIVSGCIIGYLSSLIIQRIQ